MKIFSAPRIAKHRRRRPQHGREDDARRRAALRGGRHHAARPDRGRHLSRPTSTPKRSNGRSRSTSPAPTRSTGTRGSTSWTPPATGSSRPRRARRSPAADSVLHRLRRRLGRRGPDREGLEVRRRNSTGRSCSSSTGWTASGPPSTASWSRSRRSSGARSSRSRSRSARRRTSGDRGPRPDGGATSTRAESARTGRSRRTSPNARSAEHEKLVEMVAEGDDDAHGEVLRAGDARGGRHPSGPEEGDRGEEDLPGPLRLLEPRRRRPADPRRLRVSAPLARGADGRGNGQGRQARRGLHQREGPRGRAGLQDGLRSLRRPHLLHAGPLRALPVRRQLLERHARACPSASRASSCRRARSTSTFPRRGPETSSRSRS